MRYYHLALAVLVWSTAAIFAACAQQPQETPTVAVKGEIATRAVAVLHPAKGYEAHGTVTFDRVGRLITITADLDGLTPGVHGFHVHTYGDMTAPDLSSAGGHFNPDNKPHGAPWDAERHVGDLGNVTANVEGHVHMVMQDSVVAFYGPHSIIGRSVIVHQGEDDLVSQPSGNAGPRIAGGVIGIAKPMTPAE